MTPPRSACGASPPGGRSLRPGAAGSAAAAWGWFAGLAALLLATAAGAQAPLALYEGVDRMERIVAAAKKEGTLTLYTTIAEKDLPVIIKPFEAKYSVKVNVWRAGTDKVLQRSLAEAAARRDDMDVVHFGSPEMEALAREIGRAHV